MNYTLKNRDVELTDDEVKEIIKINSTPKEEKVIGLAIKNRITGSTIFRSSKNTYKEAIIEKGNADLSSANLCGAELQDAKFFGRGGTQKLTKAQLPDFLNALGFQVLE